MRYLNATRTSFGEDRRVYKAGVGGVTNSQEIFNVSYDNGRVDVFLNGVRLLPDDDYTRTTSGIGTNIDLVSAIGANNVLEVVGYQGINSGNALVEDNFIVGTNSTGSGGSYGGSATVFNVASSAGDTVSVWRNGIKLVPTTDYTVQASANTVTLASPGASSADEITVQVVGVLAHADFIQGTDLQDDDAFGSASAAKVASSESIKAYADTKLASSTASSTYQTITNSDKLAYQSVPHIIPGVLYPAVSGNDINGTDIDTSHGSTYTYGTTHTDGRKYYYTDIKGSKPIKDPRVGGHFGSQRHKFKSLQLLEQETATHGNNVYSIDGREWLRSVDVASKQTVANTNYGNGIELVPDASNNFFEITGYYNDINFLVMTMTNCADAIEVSVNGTVSQTNTTIGGRTTVTTPLSSRYVDPASLINGGSTISTDLGTTPAINTLKFKITSGSGEYLRLYGIELIAQDTTSTANRSKIQIPSQNVVSYGKKFNVNAEGSSGHHYDPFNNFNNGTSLHSAFVDTATSLGLDTAPGSSAKWAISNTNNVRPYNGGRVVKWVDSSGVIKTSVNMMPPNAQNISSSVVGTTEVTTPSATNTTPTPIFSDDAIDHSLSEVAKAFHFREFGNGAANGGTGAIYADASMLTTSADDIAYVMDDGLTSLSGSSLKIQNETTFGGIRIDANSKSMYFTFIGTGIQTIRQPDGYTTQEPVTWAQNLPYGSHICEIQRDGSANQVVKIDGVTVETNSSASPAKYLIHGSPTFFQPKKPPIPEDACVLADYMLMADFVGLGAGNNTDKRVNISKGVRRISGSRDVFYDNTDSSDSWKSTVINIGAAGGLTTEAADNSYTGKYKIAFFGDTVVHYSHDPVTRFLDNACTFSSGTKGTTVDISNTNSAEVGARQFSITDGPRLTTLTVDSTGASNSYTTKNVVNSLDLATPIHTSSHYQTFETPFLNELVGGDRNMEQNNLVCSPDGKTWDEVTRDTSYLGNNLVYLEAVIAPYTNYTGTNVRGAFHHKFLSKRGTIDLVDMTNKGNWALAYDRLVCLVPGQYHIEVCNRIHSGSSQNAIDILKNGVRIGFFENGSAANYSCFSSADATFKRGDYLQADHNRVTGNNYYTGEAGECNVRIFKV